MSYIFHFELLIPLEKYSWLQTKNKLQTTTGNLLQSLVPELSKSEHSCCKSVNSAYIKRLFIILIGYVSTINESRMKNNIQCKVQYITWWKSQDRLHFFMATEKVIKRKSNLVSTIEMNRGFSDRYLRDFWLPWNNWADGEVHAS